MLNTVTKTALNETSYRIVKFVIYLEINVTDTKVVVFWVVTLCSDVVRQQRFGGPYCRHLQVLRNDGILPHHNTVSEPGRP